MCLKYIQKTIKHIVFHSLWFPFLSIFCWVYGLGGLQLTADLCHAKAKNKKSYRCSSGFMTSLEWFCLAVRDTSLLDSLIARGGRLVPEAFVGPVWPVGVRAPRAVFLFRLTKEAADRAVWRGEGGGRAETQQDIDWVICQLIVICPTSAPCRGAAQPSALSGKNRSHSCREENQQLQSELDSEILSF